MKVLGIDVETTGLSTTKDQIVELGLVLWDWERKTPLIMQSLIRRPSIPMNPQAAKITGIKPEDFDHAYPDDFIQKIFSSMIDKADYFMAHNARFDKSFVVAGFPELDLDNNRWIDYQFLAADKSFRRYCSDPSLSRSESSWAVRKRGSPTRVASH